MGICASVPEKERNEHQGISTPNSNEIARKPIINLPIQDSLDDGNDGRLSSPEDRLSPTFLVKKSMKRIIAINEQFQDFSKAAARQSSHSNAFTRATFSDSTISPYEVVQEMLRGNHRFVRGNTLHLHQDFKRIAAVAPKQHPLAAVLSCADSRVPVEIVFDCGFGDVFVCRVAGNLATHEELASLEYAVLECGIKVIMVMGHTNCGAIKAALSGKAFPGHIDSLIGNLDIPIMRTHARASTTREEVIKAQSSILKHGAKHERSKVDSSEIDAVIRENIRYQLERIERSPIIYDALESGALILVPCLYCIQTGRVEVLTAHVADVDDVKLTEK